MIPINGMYAVQGGKMERAKCNAPARDKSRTTQPVLLACTFLMGLHSTLFGPVKFAYLPQARRPFARR